ncbi:MAG: NAD-dependent epimerase/dehydratase family protein [Ruminococcus sp.]|nr:NAD-dependent epimerase/dehydratase family protein [Ruminococcus sp.]
MDKNHPLYREDINNIITMNGLDSLKGKSVLITGATGLIGVHLIDVLMAFGNIKVYAVGRSKIKAEERLGEYFNNPHFSFIEQDVCQPFPKDLHVDYIIPGASNTHPLAYSQYPIETIQINVNGIEHALKLAEKCNASVLCMSSVEIYGNAEGDDIFTEDFTGKLNLSTSRACYTESKRLAEALCQSYISEKGIDVKIVRLSRIFGPTMLMSDSKASSQFIKKALNNEDIILKSKGNQFFSYTYVTDAVAAIIYVMINGKCGEAYNISNEKCNVHLKDFAQICAKYNDKAVVFNIPTETEQKGYSVATQAILDNSKLKSLGFSPRYEMSDAINRTIEILKKRDEVRKSDNE